MRFLVPTRAYVALAGVAGIVVGTVCVTLARVQAADDVAPPVVHMAALLATELPPNPKTGNRVSPPVYRSGAGVIQAIQVGNLGRHTHETASEMFYVVEGTAQMTVGDAKESLKPGDLMVVPKGVPHSIKSDGPGLLKAVLITMPPRSADDVHFLN